MHNKEWNPNEEVTLLDLLDVLLDKGVALRGELVISIAGIDLVYLDLRLLLTSVEKLVRVEMPPREGEKIHGTERLESLDNWLRAGWRAG